MPEDSKLAAKAREEREDKIWQAIASAIDEAHRMIDEAFSAESGGADRIMAEWASRISFLATDEEIEIEAGVAVLDAVEQLFRPKIQDEKQGE
jgi:hypothetical protein